LVSLGAMPPEATPPVDVNKPVENPSLVSAMSHFDASRPLTQQTEVTRELNAANYLIPILRVQIPTTPKEPDGSAVVTKDTQIKILQIPDASGKPCLPLFTDWRAVRAWNNSDVSTLVMPAKAAWDFILSHDVYSGGIVNPGEKPIVLSRDAIRALRDKIPST
jgi:type III secretion system (T3SS) SseB-like protein